MHNTGTVADVASYSAVIHACAKSSDLQRAEAWVYKMQEVGVDPNVVTYNSVINACARCGASARAESWLEQMERKGVSPGLLTYNSLINAAVKSGNRARAENWITDMKCRGVQPDGVSYSTVIHAWAMAHDAPRAEHWFEELWHNGAVDEQTCSFCYNSVCQAWARAGDAARATSWLQEAINARAKVNAISFTAVAACNLKHDRPQEAERWLKRMQQDGIEVPLRGAGGAEAVAAVWMQRGDQARALAVRALAMDYKGGPTVRSGPRSRGGRHPWSSN
jgi:pentatricopeptide repeat protein